jgi:hypothetical protein
MQYLHFHTHAGRHEYQEAISPNTGGQLHSTLSSLVIAEQSFARPVAAGGDRVVRASNIHAAINDLDIITFLGATEPPTIALSGAKRFSAYRASTTYFIASLPVPCMVACSMVCNASTYLMESASAQPHDRSKEDWPMWTFCLRSRLKCHPAGVRWLGH